MKNIIDKDQIRAKLKAVDDELESEFSAGSPFTGPAPKNPLEVSCEDVQTNLLTYINKPKDLDSISATIIVNHLLSCADCRAKRDELAS